MNDIREAVSKYNFKIDGITYKDKVSIINTDNGKFVVKKKKNNDLRELFRYLKSKGFGGYLDYINDDEDGYQLYPFLNSLPIDKEEQTKELIGLLAILHNKTSFYKSFSVDEIKEFYEHQIDLINDLERYYDNLRIGIEEQIFPSPSCYYLLRNISWVFHSLNSSKYFLGKWYEIVQNKKNKRLCLIHGNLDLDHFVGEEGKVLISWDNAHNDIPIYDLLHLYQGHFNETSFYTLFNIYEERSPLLFEERYLLFSLMFLPQKIKFDNEEIINTKNVYTMINYLKTSSEIISNYHTNNTDSKSKQHN